MQRSLWAAVAAGLMLLQTAKADPAPPDLRQFVQDICMKREVTFLRTGEAAFYGRWTHPIRVQFHSGSPEVRQQFANAGGYLNDILEGTGIRFEFASGFSPDQAGLAVFLDPPDQMVAQADKYHFLLGDAAAFMMATGGDHHTIEHEVAYLNAAAFPGDSLKRAILWLLVGALGPSGHSTVVPGSLFAPGYVHHGEAWTLSPVEQAALVFVMKKVRPGATLDEIGKEFDAHGASVTAAAQASEASAAIGDGSSHSVGGPGSTSSGVSVAPAAPAGTP